MKKIHKWYPTVCEGDLTLTRDYKFNPGTIDVHLIGWYELHTNILIRCVIATQQTRDIDPMSAEC